MENFDKRLKLMTQIETETDSNLISLVYNTTSTKFRTQLASDILPSFNSLLKSIPKDNKKKNVCLLLHSSGGTLDVATSFVYMMRKKFKVFYIIIPEIAQSAATVLSFGADKILMSQFSCLSPFDPQFSLSTKSGIIGASTEDIKGYYSLINELLKDDVAKVQAFTILANRFPPEVLGNLERVQKQVEAVASKLLGYLNFSGAKIDSIINKFQTEFFSHQYRIHFDEAKKLGLNVELMDEKLENLCSDLLEIYKENLGTKSDLEIEIPEDQEYTEIVINRSYLECKYSSFSYKTQYRVFKGKKVEVEELGWLESELKKKKKGGGK